MIFSENILSTRHVARTIGPFWDQKIVLVLQVLDKRDGPSDHHNLPNWLGPYWRDARVSDLTTEDICSPS